MFAIFDKHIFQNLCKLLLQLVQYLILPVKILFYIYPCMTSYIYWRLFGTSIMVVKYDFIY